MDRPGCASPAVRRKAGNLCARADQELADRLANSMADSIKQWFASLPPGIRFDKHPLREHLDTWRQLLTDHLQDAPKWIHDRVVLVISKGFSIPFHDIIHENERPKRERFKPLDRFLLWFGILEKVIRGSIAKGTPLRYSDLYAVPNQGLAVS